MDSDHWVVAGHHREFTELVHQHLGVEMVRRELNRREYAHAWFAGFFTCLCLFVSVGVVVGMFVKYAGS